MVGRPREFDVDQVLDAAMQAFWAKGYEATTLTDLTNATGLHKGSLYQAFGDKHTLFKEALNRYLADMRRAKNELLAAAETPLDGIRAVGHGMLDIADADCDCPKGCLAVNSLVELAPHDPEIRTMLEDHAATMRASLEENVTRAQAAGQMRKDRPAELVAAMIMTFMAGLTTTMKGPITREDAHQLLDAQIDALT